MMGWSARGKRTQQIFYRWKNKLTTHQGFSNKQQHLGIPLLFSFAMEHCKEFASSLHLSKSVNFSAVQRVKYQGQGQQVMFAKRDVTSTLVETVPILQ